MIQLHFIILLLAAFLTSCTGDTTKDSNPVLMAPSGLTDEKAAHDTTTKFKKEIPSYPDGQPDLFYRLAQQKTKQLQLDTLQGGYDSLQIRIWYDFSLINLRKLLIIKRTNSLWTATSYTLTVDWDFRNLTETIKAKTVEEVNPKQGWDNFLKKIFALQITALPNANKINGYSFGTDGRQFNIEVATKNQYRFYGYWEPQLNREKFPQAKNMADILQLIKDEFNISADW